MPLYKKILIGITGFLLLLLMVNSGLNYWIDRQLPKIIAENNATPYFITYKDIKVKLWSGNVKAIN